MLSVLVAGGLIDAIRHSARSALPVLRGVFDSELAVVVLLGVFVLEGAMLLYFVPSEGIVPGAIVLLAPGFLRTVSIIAVAVLGATAGQFVLFTLAKRGGRERVLESRLVRLPESGLDRFDGWFERWGGLVVPVTNALPFFRGMLTVPAGVAEMSDRRFVLLSAFGTFLFESALALLSIGLFGQFT